MSVRSITLSTASNTTISTYTALKLDGAGRSDAGCPQNVYFGAKFTGSGAIAVGATVTVRAVLADATNVYAVRDFTLTATSATALVSGSGNDRVAVASDQNLIAPSMDLLGAEYSPLDTANSRDWYFGVLSAFPANVTAVTLYVFDTNIV